MASPAAAPRISGSFSALLNPCRGDLDAASAAELAQLRQRIVSGQAVFSQPHAGPPCWRRQRRDPPRPARASSPRGRALLPRPGGRAAVAAAAVTATCALAAGLAAAAITGTGPAPRAPGRIALDAFLGRAAAVARTQDSPLGRPGQVFYLKTLEDISAGLPGYPPTKSCQVAWDPPPSVGGTAGGDDTSIPTRPAPQFCASGVPGRARLLPRALVQRPRLPVLGSQRIPPAREPAD